MTNYEIQQALCNAIAKHFVVQLKYEDDLRLRTVEPCAVYKSTQDKILLTGTQTANPNASMLYRPSPRNFELDQIKQLNVTDETFKMDLRFDTRGPKFAPGIICAIKPNQARILDSQGRPFSQKWSIFDIKILIFCFSQKCQGDNTYIRNNLSNVSTFFRTTHIVAQGSSFVEKSPKASVNDGVTG
ncbi:MAG: hypothetical protein WBO10_16070 [Pyrinomonadaceae bacterium]